ncbi:MULTISPECIES: GNAT family N-acetyltransferase [unclassified Jeotgalibaca]|uniref:GNAT family N-acetyltransferase n=1 Tax=unclassified Jeotgalibaca TaxID=2621505 RepID=UPI003FD4D0D3
MEFVKHGNGYRKLDESGKMVAEITYKPIDDNTVGANHTFVDPSLRGQGVAEKMLDHLVDEMRKEGKKIVAQCSYVVTQFDKKPDKYADVMAEKK